MITSHYRNLEVWQLAMRLAHAAYDCSNLLPPIERYVLLRSFDEPPCLSHPTSRRDRVGHIPENS